MSRFVGLLEWTFIPELFFDGKTWTEHTDVGPIHFGAGVVQLPLPDPGLAWDSAFSFQAMKIVNGVFTAHGLMYYRQFQLSSYSPYQVCNDGTRNYIEPDPDQMNYACGGGEVPPDPPPVPLTETDAASLAQLLAKYLNNDRLLAWMVSTFKMSAGRSDQEIWLLYGIRDAVVACFGSGQAARSALGISKKDWQIIGDVADARPSAYSRHAGAFYDQPESITEQDRKVLRGACLRIIERYLHWLSCQHRVDP